MKCDCTEFCERSGIGKIGEDTAAWFTPYIPEIFGGKDAPNCKRLEKDSDIKMRPHDFGKRGDVNAAR